MTISRITTWVDGQILSAGALNAEFDNILNNATALVSPLTANLSFGLNQATNFVVERLAASPAVVTTGRVYFNTFTNSLHVGVSAPGSTAYWPVGPVQGISRVMGLYGSLVANVGTFSAQKYHMMSSGGQTLIVQSTATITANTQTAGPTVSGRDQAAAFGSTDVHFYAIMDRIGSTAVFGICSSNPPEAGPALGNYWTYLCSAKYSTASSAVVTNVIVRGAQMVFTTPIPVIGITTTATTFTSTTPTLAPSLRVPAVASHMDLWVRNVGAIYAAPQTSITADYTITSESTPFGEAARGSVAYASISTAPLNITVSQGRHRLAVGNAGPVLISSGTISTGLSGFTLGADLQGYTVPNGDN